MEETTRLQRHLPLFRSCAGWTSKDLGDKLGVSRQTISTLEKRGSKLTKIQYLAIRKVLDDEIAKDQAANEDVSETPMLATLLEVLVDHPEKYTSTDVDAMLERAKLMAPAIMKKPSERKTVSSAWKAILVTTGSAMLSAAMIALLGGKKGK